MNIETPSSSSPDSQERRSDLFQLNCLVECDAKRTSDVDDEIKEMETWRTL